MERINGAYIKIELTGLAPCFSTRKSVVRTRLRTCVFLTLAVTVTMVTACGYSSGYSKTRVCFESAGDELSGALVLPDRQQGPFPVVIFVHGDGALPHDAYGYYSPIWNALAERGIASFSWNKPGVGDSEGNWLMQTMDDRAAEVVAAQRFLRQSGQVTVDGFGLIGFSQAGWVLPRLADQPWVDYMIFVSTAVNWNEQGIYMTRKRMAVAGKAGTKEEREEITQDRKFNELLQSRKFDYNAYLEFAERYGDENAHVDPMSEDRFEFVKKNGTEDATHELGNIEVPVLALFGADDLNVDIQNSVKVYRSVFEANKQADYTYQVFPDATHQLTKSRYFNKQIPGLIDVLKMNVLGSNVFAAGALDAISGFAAAHNYRYFNQEP